MCVPFLNTSIVSLFYFNFIFLKSTQSVRVEKAQRKSEADRQTEGDLIWSRFSFGED